MRETTIEGPKAFAPTLCVAQVAHVTDGENTRDQITRGKKVKTRMIKLGSVHSILLNGNPKECWSHTCDACVITTWRFRIASPQ